MMRKIVLCTFVGFTALAYAGNPSPAGLSSWDIVSSDLRERDKAYMRQGATSQAQRGQGEIKDIADLVMLTQVVRIVEGLDSVLRSLKESVKPE